jgi:uncharacterized protein (TIGR00730 family)
MSSAPPVESPYTMKEQDKNAKKLKPTTKSYNNKDFLNGKEARIIRILCEFQEPAQRLNDHRIKGTILFFGSARAMMREDYDKTFAEMQDQLTSATGARRMVLEEKIAGFRKVEWMCEWVTKAELLARKVTEWAMSDLPLKRVMARHPSYLVSHDKGELSGRAGAGGPINKARFDEDDDEEEDDDELPQAFVVTTGGGPGLMEAANRGAASVPGAKTIGMGISLPFENGLNPYVSDGLEFEFHYFFTRKFWMMYSVRALIVCPGGFGTMDEMFELLTLRQTKKIPDLPIVLLCSRFWKTAINWQALADFGVISQKEVDGLCFADSVEEAFDFLVAHFTAGHVMPVPPSPQIGAAKISAPQDVPSPMK